jgi:hypothetical protein
VGRWMIKCACSFALNAHVQPDPTSHKYCLGEQHHANRAISRWNTANVGFKPDKSLGAFGSRDLSALIKPPFSVLNLYLFALFLWIEIQPFSNYKMTSIGLEQQLLMLRFKFLSIPHSEMPAIFMHGQKRPVCTSVKHHKKAYRP